MKLREVLKTLPLFTSDFSRHQHNDIKRPARIKYAYDFGSFSVSAEKIRNLPKFPWIRCPLMCDQVTALDLEEYTEYLRKHIGSQESYTNGKRTEAKLSALRTFYSYYFKRN